jgi:hypothetical protein
MNASSEPFGTRARWTFLAAFILGLAAGPAFAHHDSGGGGGGSNQCEQSDQRTDETTPVSGQRTNPCNNDQIMFQGSRRTTTRDKVKRDCSVESFQQLKTDASGMGAFATYKIFEEFQDSFRFGPRRPTIHIHREDERIIATKETLLGKQTDEAASFFHTLHTKTETSADGRRTRTHSHENTRCKRDDHGHDD